MNAAPRRQIFRAANRLAALLVVAFALLVNTPAAAQQSSDATLSALTAKSSTSLAGTFSALTLSPSTFAATTTEYSALVPNATRYLELTPTVNESNATVRVSDATNTLAVASGSASSPFPLDVGANAIKVEVTAQDTTTTKTYMVRVTRQDSNGQPIWAATLTAAHVSGLYGCDNTLSGIRCSENSRVTDTTISLSGTTHSVVALNILAGDLTFNLNPAPSTALRGYSLHVGGESFPLITETGRNAEWSITQTWSEGQVVPVTLQRTPAIAPGGAPTKLYIGPEPGKLTVGWIAPTDTGTRALSGYDMQYKETSAADQTAASNNPSTGWVTVSGVVTRAPAGFPPADVEGRVVSELSGLTDGTSYDVRVRAVNEGGGGPWVTGTATPGRTLLSSTLTIIDLGADGLGCTGGGSTACKTPDLQVVNLNDDDFVIDGVRVTIQQITVSSGTLTVVFGLAPTTKLKTYSFHVGTTAFALSSATITGQEAVWSNTGLTWTAGNTVSLSLRLPQSASTTPTVRLSATPSTVTEGQSVTITATLSAALSPNADVVIPLTLTAGSGTTSSDYGTLASITIPSGQTSATGTITTTQDADADNETFTVSLGTLPATVTAGSPNSVTITITEAAAPSTLTLLADTLRVSPGEKATITAAIDENAPVDTVVMLADPMSRPSGTYTLTLAPRTLTITSGTKTSTAAATLTVSEDADIGTKIELTAVDPIMSGTYRLTADPLVIEVVSPLQAEQLHRAALPEVARAVAGRVTGAISARVGQVLNGGGNTASANLGGQSSLAGVLQTHALGLINENRPVRDLLHGSNFVLPFHTESSRGDGVRKTSLWGSGEYRNLSGENDGLEFDGNLHGAQIGVDSKLRENLLAGVALSWSQGEFDYQDTGEGGGQGDYEIDLQAIHPYLGWRSGALSWWATAGYGTGEVEITPEGSTATASDVNLRSIGTGGSGLLWSNSDNTATVRLKGEFTQTEMEVERSEQTAALTVDATLMRLAAEASRTRSLTNGGHLSPSFSFGMRHDGGDGHTGAGAEITTGVRYTNPQTGINASATAHALVGRNDYEEWGIQATLRNSPGADGQGLSFVMSPGYGNGNGASNTGQIWSNGLRGDISAPTNDPSGRLEIRLGYGLSSPGERNGLLTPWSGLTLQENGKLYRLGLDWASGGPFPFTLRLHGERRESENTNADHAVLLKGEARF